MKFVFLLLLLSQTGFGSEELNPDVDPLNEVIKTLDCFEDEPETCASKGVKTSNSREPNSDANESNAEPVPKKYLKKRKRKSQKNEEEFNYGEIIKLELKTEEVFGGCLLFSNVNEKIKAAHWKNDHTVEHLECGFHNWGFKTKQEAKQALEEYVICQKLEIYENLWIPTSFNIDSVVGEYYTESIKLQEKSAIQRKGPFAEQINAKQKENDYENVNKIESVGQTQDFDERETLANILTENELLFREIMRKYDKEVSGEEIQPKKKKYFTLKQLKAKTLERKHADESEEDKMETKEKTRGDIILNDFDSSDESELNPDQYREYYLNQNDFNDFDLSDFALDPYSSNHDQEREADDQECSTKKIKGDVAKMMKLRDIGSFLPKIMPKMKMVDTRLSKNLDEKEDYADDSTDKSSRKEYSGTMNSQKACRKSFRPTTDESEESYGVEARDVRAFFANIRHEFNEMKSKITKRITELWKWEFCVGGLDYWFDKKIQQLYETCTVNENSNIKAIYIKWREIAEISLEKVFQKKTGKEVPERKNHYFIELSNGYEQPYLWWVRNAKKKKFHSIMRKEAFGAFALQKEVEFDSLEIDNTVIVCKKDKGYAYLLRIVEKGDDNITVHVLHGKHKGKQETFSKNEVKNKLMKVEYYLSQEQESHLIEKTEKYIPNQIKRLSDMQKEIEELLFRLCYNAYDSKDCKAMMRKWRDAQADNYNGHEFENSNPFWTEAKVRMQRWENKIQNIPENIRTKLKRIAPQSYEPTEEEEREIHMILLKMLWLEIKAQSFSKKFREFVTDMTTLAFKCRGKKPHKEPHGVRIRSHVYYMCTQSEKIQKLYDDVKNAYDGGTEGEYAERPLSALFGPKRVQSMIRTVHLPVAKRLQNKIKDYMEKLEREKISDKKNTRPSTFRAPATARIEEYEVVRLWNGDLSDCGIDGPNLQQDSLENTTEKIKVEFILNPNELPGALDGFYLTWVRFNLGWVRFHYKGTPFLAEVALDTIEAGEEFLTCYVGENVMSTPMKYSDEADRKEVVKNVENKVKEMVHNIEKSNVK